jgi:hypothetical protein
MFYLVFCSAQFCVRVRESSLGIAPVFVGAHPVPTLMDSQLESSLNEAVTSVIPGLSAPSCCMAWPLLVGCPAQFLRASEGIHIRDCPCFCWSASGSYVRDLQNGSFWGHTYAVSEAGGFQGQPLLQIGTKIAMGVAAANSATNEIYVWSQDNCICKFQLMG